MAKERTVARRAALGYPSPAWLGLLVGYALVVLSFSFLIGLFAPNSVPVPLALVPVVAIVSSAGLFLLWKLLAFPRALPWPGRGRPGTDVDRREDTLHDGLPALTRSNDWHASPLVNRVAGMLDLEDGRLDGRSGALRSRAAQWDVDDAFPRLRIRPGITPFDPRFAAGERIPTTFAEGTRQAESVRIVDLAYPHHYTPRVKLVR